MNDDVKENLIAIAILIAVASAILWLIFRPQTESNDVRAHISPGISPTLGNPEAPVTVVLFSDFECPFCRTFALESFPRIREAYVDSGQVYFVFKHFPLTQIHGNALSAAEAAACAHDSGQFWEYHDFLYEQAEFTREALIEEAVFLGIDEAEFSSCITDGNRRREVLSDKEEGIRASVSGTPTFFFNGRKVVGALTPEDFEAHVAMELP